MADLSTGEETEAERPGVCSVTQLTGFLDLKGHLILKTGEADRSTGPGP